MCGWSLGIEAEEVANIGGPNAGPARVFAALVKKFVLCSLNTVHLKLSLRGTLAKRSVRRRRSRSPKAFPKGRVGKQSQYLFVIIFNRLDRLK